MAKQVGPTLLNPELNRGLRGREPVQARACTFHQGQELFKLREKAEYMGASDLLFQNPIFSLYPEAGPYMWGGVENPNQNKQIKGKSNAGYPSAPQASPFCPAVCLKKMIKR